MNVFLTGATGFIGQHVLRALVKRGHTVTCFVRKSAEFPADITRNVRIVLGDEASLSSAPIRVERFEAVVHLAGNASLGMSAEQQRVNIELMRALIGRFSGSPSLRKFIFTSSIGAIDRRPEDDCTAPLHEETPPHPMSDYGKSKLACEQLLRSTSLPYVILRPGLVYGPGMRSNSHLRVFIEGVRTRSLFTRFDFPGRLSFVHVDDVVGALLHVLHRQDLVHRTFFVVGDAPVAIGSALREIGQTLGVSAGTVGIPRAVVGTFRLFRRFLPLTAQGLMSDVLWATNQSIASAGFKTGVTWPEGVFATILHDARDRSGFRPGQAVVTGGASGIGKAIAEQLACNGLDVVVADKDNRQGKKVAEKIGGRYVKCDLSSTTGVDRVRSVVMERSTRIVVNNAGIGNKNWLKNQRSSDIQAMLSVNCIAPTRLTQEALQAFSSRGGGTVINIGSSAGLQPLPSMSVYAATKAYVRAFTLGVQGEYPAGDPGESIEIILVSPSGTDTNFQSTAGVTKSPSERLLDPRVVARRIISLIGKGHAVVTIGTSGKLMAVAARLVPIRWQTRMWSRMMKAYR